MLEHNILVSIQFKEEKEEENIKFWFCIFSSKGNNTGVTGNNSRRQSNVPRCNDSESASSLQGSLKRVVEHSPKSSQRKQVNRTPLYLSGENSRTMIGPNDSSTNNAFKLTDDESTNQHQLQQLDCCGQKKPFAMVRPRRILCTSNNEHHAFLSTIDLNYNVAGRLRESKSLDLIPNQLRHRLDIKRLQISKLRDQSTCSLDAGVALINRDAMPFISDFSRDNFECISNRMVYAPSTNDSISSATIGTIATVAATTAKSPTNRNINKSKLQYKILNNNCNGPIAQEEAQCPLLYRQNSLSNSPQDENLFHQKRWRSLETIDSRHGTEPSSNKKNANRGSIRSWLYNLFQGNGFNDTSLRKVGVVQSRVKGFSGFGELPPAPEHESIV